MTGPMHNDERTQELAERNSWLLVQLNEVALTAADLHQKMTWTPDEWNEKLRAAEADRAEFYGKWSKITRELDETKQALAAALHDARRWRSIAEDGNR